MRFACVATMALLFSSLTGCATNSAPTSTATLADQQQLRDALPGQAAMPTGWDFENAQVDTGPTVLSAEDSATACQQRTTSPCTGLSFVASVHYSKQNGTAADSGVQFTLASFDTVVNAQSTMNTLTKSITTTGHWQQLDMNTSADEIQAYAANNSFDVVERIGTVMAFITITNTAANSVAQQFAQLQATRVESVSTNKNPDAP